MERETRCEVRRYGDVYHTLSVPIAQFSHAFVRLLTSADVALLESAPPEISENGFGSPRALLAEGFAAGAIISGGIVSVAQTYALSERHADIGVFTVEDWRSKGLATAAVAAVTQRVHATGRTPVWSTGEDELASLRVAEKLGFREVSRRTYLIPKRDG